MRRIPDSESRPENGTGRGVILFFALGIVLSLSAIGIGIFGTVNVADWAFPTVAARWTSSAEERNRAAATLARQTDIAAAITLTDYRFTISNPQIFSVEGTHQAAGHK